MGPKIANKCSNKRGNLEIIISVRFLGESKNGFVIPDHMDSSLPKKNGKSEKKNHLPRQRHVLVLLVLRKIKGKNNKSIVAAKTRRKSNINYV